MTVHLSRRPIALDPLIAEAKRRMRRRRFLVALAVVAAGAATLVISLAPRTPKKTPSGAAASRQLPQARRLVLNRSIGGVRLGELRTSVERALGPEPREGYFGGRLTVDYVYKVGPPTKRVQSIRTTWSGFHTESGIHVGSSLEDVRRVLHAQCAGSNDACNVGHGPGGPGTMLWMRHGKVAWILIWFVS